MCGAVGILAGRGRSGDAACDACRSGGGLTDTFGDLGRSPVLLVHRSCDGGREAVDLAHDGRDRSNIVHGPLRRHLHLGNLRGDLLGCLCGLDRERLDLRRNHCKAAPCLARPCRLDCRVESQEVGLAGNIPDEPYHLVDMLSRSASIPIVSLASFAMLEARRTMLVASWSCPSMACTDSPSWPAGAETGRAVGGGL